ncbi:MAG: VWA domain-containing protein [Vicinamibacteria bacterium]|nr:VWA domain-containing protein [Vicinamibacteria bacterium]
MRRALGVLLGTFVALTAAAPAVAAEPPLIALVLDTSGSLTADDVARRQQIAASLLAALPAGSEIAVFNFDDESRLVLPRSSDRAKVLAAIDAQGRAGRFTAMHDALYDATRYVSDVAGRRRGIVLVTDGKDENSALRLEDGAALARDGNVPVFAVGVGKVQDRVLRRIAKLTGGRYFGTDADGASMAETIVAGLPVSVVPATHPAGTLESSAGSTAVVPAVPAAVPASAAASASIWVWLGPLLGVLAGLGVALLILWPRGGARPAAAAPAAYTPAAAPAAEAFEEPGTLVMRMEDLPEPTDRTMVITMKPLLHVTKGPDSGRLFEVSLDAATSIGRADGNDAALGDRTVSSQHCRIRPLPDAGFEVIDLQSTNGTFVNDRRVSRQRLVAGDVIKVGESSISFRMDHMKGD